MQSNFIAPHSITMNSESQGQQIRHWVHVFQNELMLGDESLYLNFMKLEKYHLSFSYISIHSRAVSKHSDIEFRRLFVREQANIKQDSIMRFLFHPLFFWWGWNWIIADLFVCDIEHCKINSHLFKLKSGLGASDNPF